MPQFDTLIVFGEGPVKPVLTPPEITTEQQNQWNEFKNDPLQTREPNFWVIEDRSSLSQLIDIDKAHHEGIDNEKMKEFVRHAWQHMSQFTLKRWGRQNALAAGLALCQKITKEVILSGGPTIPAWAKTVLTKERLERWPTEAELMREVIRKNFGQKYYRSFGK